VRSFMTFETPVGQPDNPAEIAGRALAISLAQGLSERGLVIHESVDEHDSYGWYFVAGPPEQPVWCMVQRSDRWLVITKPEIPFLERLFGKRVDPEAHHRLCQVLHAAAQAIPGVSDIRWFSEKEFQQNASGAPTP